MIVREIERPDHFAIISFSNYQHQPTHLAKKFLCSLDNSYTLLKNVKDQNCHSTNESA